MSFDREPLKYQYSFERLDGNKIIFKFNGEELKLFRTQGIGKEHFVEVVKQMNDIYRTQLQLLMRHDTQVDDKPGVHVHADKDLSYCTFNLQGGNLVAKVGINGSKSILHSFDPCASFALWRSFVQVIQSLGHHAFLA